MPVVFVWIYQTPSIAKAQAMTSNGLSAHLNFESIHANESVMDQIKLPSFNHVERLKSYQEVFSAVINRIVWLIVSSPYKYNIQEASIFYYFFHGSGQLIKEELNLISPKIP